MVNLSPRTTMYWWLALMSPVEWRATFLFRI